MTSESDILRAHVDAEGLLQSADAALLSLQQRAGGALGEPLAIAPLAAIARLASRLNVVISRSVRVADGPEDVEFWIHARPRDGGVDFAFSSWTRHPARPPLDEGAILRNADFVRADADWAFELDNDLRIIRIEHLAPDAGQPGLSEFVGRKLSAMVDLIADSEGDMPILTGLAHGRGFEGQIARLRSMDNILVRLDAAALVDATGAVTGLRGSLALAEQPATRDTPDAESAAGRAPLFGQQLEQVLRIPLSRIIANADNIHAQHDGPIRRDYASYAADIANAGRHMLGLVGDLVDLQTVESEDFRPARDVLDLADIARKAAGLVAVRARDKAIRIDRPTEGDSLPALGDYRRVLQILVNLVGNAVRYSPEGSMIWIRTEMEGKTASVIIADQGRGIDPADHEKIFDRFERLNASEPGSGLGLYISRRLARAMGGDITLDSAAGQGARFMLILPAA